MALGLHEKLREKLTTDLAKILPELRVTRGIALTTNARVMLAPLDASLPGHGEIKEKLSAWISDCPLTDFIIGSINADLMSDAYVNGEHVPLSTIKGWEDAAVKAEQLVSGFEALPRAYLVSFPAPDGIVPYLEAKDGQFRLANRVRIALADAKFIEDHPVTTGDLQRDKSIWDTGGLMSLLNTGPHYEWKGAYLQLIVQGYLGRFIETNTEHEVIGDFKALWGAQLALGIAQRRRTWSAYPSKRKLIVHDNHSGNIALTQRIELDASASQLIDDIHFHDWLPDEDNLEVKTRVYFHFLKSLDFLFGKSAEADRLRLACRWLFDSYATDNELLAYVQAMVCLEIILGDASLIGEIGLGELLRNRCAYLIGKTSKQRAEILRDFREIYDVRSHIVHRGKSRMTARERELYSTLMWYCKRCIHEEIELLKKTKEADEEEKRANDPVAAALLESSQKG